MPLALTIFPRRKKQLTAVASRPVERLRCLLFLHSTDASLSPTSPVKTVAVKKVEGDEDKDTDDDIEMVVDIYGGKAKQD